jgi:hypothetical protein
VHATLFRRVPAAVVLCALGARTAAAQAPSPPQVSVGGVAFLEYVYQLKDTADHRNSFDVRRAYINVNARFSGGVGVRITPDIYRALPDNSLRYRLKYAYATWTPTPRSPLMLKLGMIHTPWVDFEDTLWDYRMQGSNALNRNDVLEASDFGAGVDGKWGPDKVNMQITVVNGEGFDGGLGDQRKDVMGRVSVRVRDTDDSSRVGGLRVTAYGHYGKATGGGKRERWLAMVSYRSRQVTLAAEGAITRDSDIYGHVYSAFGVYRVPRSKVAVIARVDVLDPEAGVNDRETRFIGGVSYQLSPNLRVLADWDHLSYETDPVVPDLNRSQALFQTQLTF